MACEDEVHVHIHTGNDDRIGQILGIVQDLQQRSITMATDLTTITAEVTEAVTVSQSAVILLNGIGAALAAAGTDPVALAALASELDASTAALAEAVQANTPAAAPA
jgi:hypothetical protein